ncbi:MULTISPECIES: AraC family transcriptional regulator [Pseudomonas]|jgi:AraC-like DNA-binding protein|uniref:AraC family transcriptional regulator n=1 Tax=Pseudomonas putida S12 TaxID=1215087 RepID=A0AA34WTQ8_PSEPU|nr:MULTISPECIES: AraC family transcriptional regulator [Pseudomonas]AJA16102.1 AraC family transcriptional regulator [Pseudomonas putida S12]TFW37501.1 AraC family transcriptional regulator [Pseudomonas putida]USX35457.1 AraC family transcriptional regulator [Pseudomonas putida]
MPALVRAASLTNYLEVSRHLGLNPHTLLAQVGLSAALLDDPNRRIPVASVINLLEASASASHCESFGLRMAELRQLSDFGEISLLLSHQRNLRDALQVIVQYRHLLNDALAIHIEEAGKTVVIREEVISERAPCSRQATELAIGVMMRLCAALLGTHWHPISANFTHAAPADPAIHRRIFGCTLVFGSEFNGIVCPAADLDSASPLANEAMARLARRYLDTLPAGSEPSLELELRKTIYLLLPMGRATLEQVAQTQGMNVRTLQRRLEDSGLTFKDLINSVRRDLVMRYLENPSYSLGRIADMLGYSMPSSFTRWFIAQYGMPPASWRARSVSPAPQARHYRG